MGELYLVQEIEEGCLGGMRDELEVIWQTAQNMPWINDDRENGKSEEKNMVEDQLKLNGRQNKSNRQGADPIKPQTHHTQEEF